jgi:hypothetical protein
MKNKLLKTIFLFTLFIPLVGSVHAFNGSTASSFADRALTATENATEQVRNKVQQRIQERSADIEQKRAQFQEIIATQFSEEVVQERFTQFQEKIEDMNTRLSERYFNYLGNTTTAIENIMERFSEEDLSTATEEALEDFYSHIEEMEEEVADQLSNEYYIEEAESVREVVQGFRENIQELLGDHRDLQETVMKETQQLKRDLMRSIADDLSEYTEEEEGDDEEDEEDEEETEDENTAATDDEEETEEE